MNSRLKVLAMSVMLGFAAGAQAQKALPNPLIQPPKKSQQDAESQAASAAAAAAAAKEAPKETESVPTELMNRVSGLQVSAIIGDTAVLRAGAAASAPGGGSGAGAGAGANPTGERGSGSGQASGGGRAQSYVVRDAEPFQLFDRYRLLPRIQDTSVVLYLMPDNPQDMNRRPQVVFRASIESAHNTPYVPSKLEPVGGGPDGSAYQTLINTGASGVGGNKSGSGSLGVGGAPKTP